VLPRVKFSWISLNRRIDQHDKYLFRRQPPPLKPGENLDVDLKLSLEDLYNGASKRMKVFMSDSYLFYIITL
jgi:hypothetical protein